MHEQSYDVMVYRYDLGEPVDWAHDCEQQLIAQQRLWNELVDIDLEARKRYYEVLRTSLPTLAQIETQLAALREEKEALWRQLRKRYDSIYVDDIALDKAARLVVDDTESTLPKPVRHLRVLAATHALRGALRNAIRTTTAGHTAVCASCGHRNDVPADDIFVTCGGCGTVYDRDENHARNLLAAGLAAGTPRPDVAAAHRVSRRERIAQARARKDAALPAGDHHAVAVESAPSLTDDRAAAGASDDKHS